jgi:hypothetical protein
LRASRTPSSSSSSSPRTPATYWSRGMSCPTTSSPSTGPATSRASPAFGFSANSRQHGEAPSLGGVGNAISRVQLSTANWAWSVNKLLYRPHYREGRRRWSGKIYSHPNSSRASPEAVQRPVVFPQLALVVPEMLRSPTPGGLFKATPGNAIAGDVGTGQSASRRKS